MGSAKLSITVDSRTSRIVHNALPLQFRTRKILILDNKNARNRSPSSRTMR